MWIVLHVVKMLASTPGGWLADCIGKRRTIAAGWLVYAASYAGFGFAESELAVWGLLVLYGLFHGLTEGPERALVAELVPGGRGTGFGWYHLVSGIGGLSRWDQAGSRAAFLVAALLALFATAALALLGARETPEGPTSHVCELRGALASRCALQYSTDALNNGPPHKTAFYGAFARVGQALGHPTRLELLDVLAQAPRTVEALATACGRSVASTSQHLQTLWRAGLVARDKDGLYVTYRLASDDVGTLYRTLRDVARAHLAEVEQAARSFLDEGADEPIDADELRERVRRGKAVVIDVRPPEEFAAAHLPDAISVPLGELEARLASLPKRKEIVAYCRGPYCVLAVEAVRLLRASGRRARRLEDGVREWGARGLPIAHREELERNRGAS